MRVLDRATISEAVFLSGAGIVLIAGVFFGTSEFSYILSLICNVGMQPSIAVSISALQLPSTIVWSLPVAVIVTTSVLLLRRSYERELIGLATCGVNPIRAFLPLFAMALVTAILSWCLNEYVVPDARRLSNGLMYSGVLNSELPRNRNCLTLLRSSSEADLVDRVFLVGNYLKRNLENVVVLDFTEVGSPKVIWSPTGFWQKGRWSLRDGHIYELAPEGRNRRSFHFGEMSYDALGLKVQDILNRGPLPHEMSAEDLRKRIDDIASSGKLVPQKLYALLYRHYSQPVGCLIVSLAALPFVTGRRRRNLYGGLGYIGFVVVVFFILQQMTTSLAMHGRLDPLAAACIPTLFVAMTGISGYIMSRNT